MTHTPALEAFAFAEGVTRLEDVRPGMRLPGIVTNVTAFGAFVDIGVHQDGVCGLRRSLVLASTHLRLVACWNAMSLAQLV